MDMDQKVMERIFAAVDAFKGKRIAVLGDLMLDAYTWGKVNRISPEAPVPVVQVTRRSCCLGGAANVIRNIVSLGASAAAFGIVALADTTYTWNGGASGVWSTPGNWLVGGAGFVVGLILGLIL